MTTRSRYDEVLDKVQQIANNEHDGRITDNVVAIFGKLTPDERRVLVLKSMDRSKETYIDMFHHEQMVRLKFFFIKALVVWVLADLWMVVGLAAASLHKASSESDLANFFTSMFEILRKLIDF